MKTQIKTIIHTNNKGSFEIKVFRDGSLNYLVQAYDTEDQLLAEELIDCDAAEGLQAYHGESPYAEAVKSVQRLLDSDGK